MEEGRREPGRDEEPNVIMDMRSEACQNSSNVSRRLSHGDTFEAGHEVNA